MCIEYKGCNMERTKRDYTLTDAKLAVYTGDLVLILTENLADFSEYALTAAKISALEALGDQFENFLPDAHYAGLVTLAVQARNAKRKDVVRKIRTVMVRMNEAIPDKLAPYERFTADVMKRLSVEEFLINVRTFKDSIAMDMADLDDEGITQAELNALYAETEALETLTRAVGVQIAVRSKKQQERVALGNQIYALVKKYANYGKDRYADNPAMFNLFIIYTDADVPKTPPDAPAIEVIEGSAELIFMQEVTSTRLWYKFAANAAYTEVNVEPSQPYFIGTGHNIIYLKGQGRNAAGWGAIAEKIIVNELQPPVNPRYNHALGRFEYEMAEGAEQVELEVSYDNGATYQQIVITSETVYVWTPPSGTLLARFRSIKGGIVSPWLQITVVIP